MVQKEVIFKDGSRIYYIISPNGNVRLKLIYSDIEYIYSKATDKYNHQLNVEICLRARQHQYFLGSDVFYTVIYLAMVDLESSKLDDSWLGKKMVLDSCKAVLLENIPYRKAANLYLRESDCLE